MGRVSLSQKKIYISGKVKICKVRPVRLAGLLALQGGGGGADGLGHQGPGWRDRRRPLWRRPLVALERHGIAGHRPPQR